MSARKLWGEMEEEPLDENLHQNVNFDPIIELGLQNIPEIAVTEQSPPAMLPRPNLITHTIQLHAYSRQLSSILEQAKKRRKSRQSAITLPTEPAAPSLQLMHEIMSPVAFLERKFTNFSLGQGPVIQPFTQESHNRALRQCAAIAIGHIGLEWCSNSAVTALADSLDFYMTKFCKTMRTVVDREASCLKTGFPDVMGKVMAEMRVGDLHEFYQKRVVEYHTTIKTECDALKASCEVVIAKHAAPEPQAEEVPELHFPATMESELSPSLETGFQMLESLEQEELQASLDANATGESKMETAQAEASKSGAKRSKKSHKSSGKSSTKKSTKSSTKAASKQTSQATPKPSTSSAATGAKKKRK